MTTRLLAGLTVAAALAALPVRAEDPTKRGFDPDPARLALSLDGGFAVETAAAAPAGTRGVAAVLDLAAGLLALERGGERDRLLEHRLSLHLLGGWSFGRVEVGVDVPVALWQDSDFSLLEQRGVTGPLVAPISRTTLGDVRIGAKVPLLDATRFPLGLAALLDVRVPTGNGDAFYSDGLAVVPSAIATRAFGPVRLDAQLGYVVRSAGQYAQLVVHDGLTYAVGASGDLPPAGPLRRWRAIAELTGGWPRGYDLSGERYRAPLSARGGLRWHAWRSLALELGGGAGLGAAGYGREAWRVFAGVRWGLAPVGAPEEDYDHDGVPNAKDQCPREPGPAALDGCPDRDKDAIHFDTGRDTIQRESFRILDEVAKLLNQHAELKKVRVEGHTDNVGSGPYNKDLSERRARSVVRYLAEKGNVERKRLEPVGFGFERSVASNATAVGRFKNRCVEFTILAE